MLLKTTSRNLIVYQKLHANPEVNVYLAKDNEADPNLYLINEICCPQTIRRHLKDLLTLREMPSLAEFVEILTLDAKLYLVFRYTKPFPIKDYVIKNKLNYVERLKLLENYLFQLTGYTGLPHLILNALTDWENVNIQGFDKIYFNFAVKPEHLADQGNKPILTRIALLIKALFPELASKKARPLGIIVDKCNKAIYRTVPELLRDVQKIDSNSLGDRFKLFLQQQKGKLDFAKNLAVTGLILLLLVVIYTRFIAPDAVSSQPRLLITRIGEEILIEDPTPKNHPPGNPTLPSVINIQKP